MTRWFVIITKLNVVKDSFFLYFYFGLVQHARDVVKLMRFNHTVYNDNSVVQVAPTDQIVFIEHFKLVQKTKCATRSNFFFELLDAGDGCVLASQNG